MLDQVSADYADEVAFVALASSASDMRVATLLAAEWFPSGRIQWALEDSVWVSYGASSTPTTILITGDDYVIGGWPGAVGEQALRERIDLLLEIDGG